MRKTSLLKISAIALLSAFALTACDDDVIAKPKGYDDNSPVITIKDYSGTVYNNEFTDIYDAIRKSSVPSDVLNELLYQYSMSVFGNYNKVTLASVTDNPYGEVTLKAAVASVRSSDKSVANEFIRNHSAYWTKNKEGKRVDDSWNVVDDKADASESEYARLDEKWETIEKRIAEKLYAAISGGTYSERNVFEEEKYVRALANNIENNVIALSGTPDFFKGVLTSAVEDKDVFTQQTKDIDDHDDFILHRANYQSNAALGENEAADQDATYVEDKIIPDIYRQLLVEQYVLDESYDTLGRTSARNIDVLAISKSGNYAKGAVNLMNTYVNDIIFDNARTSDIDLDSFKVVSNAWVGAFMSEADPTSTEEFALMNKAVPEYLVKDSSDKPLYFQGTSYGDMMEEIEKINANPALSQNESAYTGGNAYTVEIGKEIKTRELMLKDYTSTGWYVKSVGVASLPESIKNQLFDINVANALNGEECVKYEYGTEWATTNEVNEKGEIRKDVINVVGEIKGQYFLRNTTRIKGTPVQNDILFESNGTYYIVLVKDAIRSKNLNKANYVGEEVTYDDRVQLEYYINEIVQIVASNDTYQTLSKKHWIEKMEIEFHDSEVYEYFKSNFPDLFDDDDK